jgi:hypothetical protein
LKPPLIGKLVVVKKSKNDPVMKKRWDSANIILHKTGYFEEVNFPDDVFSSFPLAKSMRVAGKGHWRQGV